ncbi:unnamed protein product [Caenorhabditis sp. 36 PRJEB53466]|nr:unnamed protein product [Caenorhabditis sp. 36 PRJEB53466]
MTKKRSTPAKSMLNSSIVLKDAPLTRGRKRCAIEPQNDELIALDHSKIKKRSKKLTIVNPQPEPENSPGKEEEKPEHVENYVKNEEPEFVVAGRNAVKSLKHHIAAKAMQLRIETEFADDEAWNKEFLEARNAIVDEFLNALEDEMNAE